MSGLAQVLPPGVRDVFLGQLTIPFETFMAQALYGVEGYYQQHVSIGGKGADFYTASSSRLFALTLARYIHHHWLDFGQPTTLQVVECGAGQGDLADCLIRALEELLPENTKLIYVIDELSPGLRYRQQERLAQWVTVQEQLDDVTQMRTRVSWDKPNPAYDSVVVGNEVLDAMPVHLVRKNHHSWELGVVHQIEDRLALEFQQCPDDVAKWATRWLPIEKGQMAEVCLAYDDWFLRIKGFGKRVQAAFFDYGMTAAEWGTGIRPAGTIRAYSQHQIVDVLDSPGRVDITADVHWDAAQEGANQAGAVAVQLSRQGTFLINHGILTVLQELQTSAPNLQLNGEFKQLVLPGGMGERFEVLECQWINEGF